ncbi:MAG: hypothetical protein IJD21_04910 [Oscillospiraceae bacterium]|nr:hypothetical protein [Oscillospiraceae bacterium]
MKRIKNLPAIVLAVALLISLLSGCGAKSPVDGYYGLLEEMQATMKAGAKSDMSLDFEMDGMPIAVDLELLTKGEEDGRINGSVEVSGISVKIPEILFNDGTVIYLDGSGFADLLTLADLVDAEVLDQIRGKHLMMTVEQAIATEMDAEAIALLESTSRKCADELKARAELYSEDPDQKGTYVLEVSGNILYDLFLVAINDMIEHQDAYIDFIYDSVGANKYMTREDLETAFAEIKTSLESDDSTLPAEVVEKLNGIHLTSAISKGKDNSYQIESVLTIEIEGEAIALNISETVIAVKEELDFTISGETIDFEEFAESLVNSLYGYSYEDDYYFEDVEDVYATGTLDQLDLTTATDRVDTITIVSASGTRCSVAVPNDMNWNEAYIDSALNSVTGSDKDISYFYSAYTTPIDDLDLDAFIDDAVASFNDPEIGGDVTRTEKVVGNDVYAMALEGNYSGLDLYELFIVENISADECAVITVLLYGSDLTPVQSLVDYYDLTLPR